MLERCRGIWLDAFQDDWYDAANVNQYLHSGKQVSAFVSPAIHGRLRDSVWGLLRGVASSDLAAPRCTDFPEDLMSG